MILWIDILAFLLLAAGFALYLELSARQKERKRQRDQERWNYVFRDLRKADAGVGEQKRLG